MAAQQVEEQSLRQVVVHGSPALRLWTAYACWVGQGWTGRREGERAGGYLKSSSRRCLVNVVEQASEEQKHFPWVVGDVEVLSTHGPNASSAVCGGGCEKELIKMIG